MIDDPSKAKSKELLVEVYTDMKWVKGELVTIREDVDDLKGFKNRVYGALAVIGMGFTVIIGFITKHWNN